MMKTNEWSLLFLFLYVYPCYMGPPPIRLTQACSHVAFLPYKTFLLGDTHRPTNIPGGIPVQYQ